MPQGITLSEDEIGAVSADLFAEFFRPQLESLAARYGGLGLHCCANARHQWPHLRDLQGLRVLNICRPRAVALAAYDYFSEVAVQMHGSLSDDRVENWPGLYPPKSRVVFEVSGLSNRHEAELAAAELRRRQRANSRADPHAEPC